MITKTSLRRRFTGRSIASRWRRAGSSTQSGLNFIRRNGSSVLWPPR
jgi:hypothetical protein